MPLPYTTLFTPRDDLLRPAGAAAGADFFRAAGAAAGADRLFLTVQRLCALIGLISRPRLQDDGGPRPMLLKVYCVKGGGS
jgi:hypothetical protein